MDRIIGEFVGQEKGPLIILLGSLHGNEKAGIKAIEEVFRNLRNNRTPVRGTILGLRGNLQAYLENKRYIDYDLNRCWNEQHIENLKHHEGQHIFKEDMEVVTLNGIFEDYSLGDYTEMFLVDLHTTSSDNGNFIVVPEVFADHPVINALRLPVILDLEKHIKGALLKYAQKWGFISFAFEGGLMGSEVAVQLHMAGIWEILYTSGAIAGLPMNGTIQIGTLLQTFASELPHKLRVKFHHWITEDEKFLMKPGYNNFQKVSKDEIIAKDIYGEVRVPMDGLIFMPLYQQSGNDGFFIVEELDPLARLKYHD